MSEKSDAVVVVEAVLYREILEDLIEELRGSVFEPDWAAYDVMYRAVHRAEARLRGVVGDE